MLHTVVNDNGFIRVNHGGGSKQGKPISSTCVYNMFKSVEMLMMQDLIASVE